MVVYIGPAHQAYLDAGRASKTDMILFDFPAPTGLVGFFSGIGVFTWNSYTFHGAGNLFEVTDVGATLNGTAQGLKIRLNGDARAGLDASVLAQIDAVPYAGRPVSLYRRHMEPDTGVEMATMLYWRGYINTITHNITEGGEAYLEAELESRALDLARSGYRMRTDADQRLIDGNDGFFRNIGTVSTREIKWGNVPPYTPPAKKKKFLGIF
jgi:hypothetical protein